MATTATANYGWGKPVDGGDSDNWGVDLNAAIDAIDVQVKANDTAAQGYASTAQANAEGAGLAKAANLADLGSVAVALGNLGFGGTSGGGAWGGAWTVRLPVDIGGAVVAVIVQGGVVNTVGPDSTTPLTFPTPFPTACWGVYPVTRVSAFNSGADAFTQLVGTPSRTGCTLANQSVNNSPTIDIPWIAVGY